MGVFPSRLVSEKAWQIHVATESHGHFQLSLRNDDRADEKKSLDKEVW
jgi:hypothetical protein